MPVVDILKMQGGHVLKMMSNRVKVLFVSTSSFLVGALVIGSMMGRSASPEDTYKHLAVFTEVVSRIKSDYVEEPDLKSVTLGALNGLLESIDPYASYLSADQYQQYLKNEDARKGDLGLVLAKRYGYISVVAALPGSAGAKAGLGTGDMLESIQGVATRDMPLAYAEVLLSGEPGSNVEVSVLRVRKPEPTKMTLTRTPVKYPAVAAKLLPGEIGHVKVYSIEAGKVAQIAAAIKDLEKQGAKKLILDVRYSAVGAPQDGVDLANLFLDKGQIGYLQGQRVSKQTFEAVPSKKITSLPMVLITNRGTAGPAEVAAAALLEHKRATLVGERTYGDAAQRKAITLDDGAAVILSVAKYYAPNGKAIQDTAVVPTEAVNDNEPLDDDADTPAPAPAEARKSDEDAPLKRAVEVLSK